MLFNYSCMPFLPIPPTHPSWTHLPPLPPPDPWFSPCVLYSSSWKPFFSPSLPHFPLVIVRLFLTSMCLVIFCLLFSCVDYVPVKGEIIRYLSLTTWLISLSIIFKSLLFICKNFGFSPFSWKGLENARMHFIKSNVISA